VILVVEDEDTLRTLAQRMLELFGYRVLTAANGAEAIDLFTEHRSEVAAVFTDMMMPVMDGDAAIRALLALAPSTRIIATSGLDAESMETKALTAGARCFLPKPYTAEPLLRTLREVLEAP
jgi:CheY-like chemotaxis protein